ncbi:MAG: NfeD family protein [Opitutales bacterium]|nr:NfeD family protein [Opitutales bacterium]
MVEEGQPIRPGREILSGYFRLFGKLVGVLLFPLALPFLLVVWIFAYGTAKGSIPVNQTMAGTVAKEEFTLAGEIGEVVQDLRPEGKLRCRGSLYEARSESGFLPEGTKVTILRRGVGEQVMVRGFKGGAIRGVRKENEVKEVGGK